MPGSQERLKDETEQLQCFLDGELLPHEAAAVRARLAESPELRCRLRELQRVGELVRLWAGDAQGRAADLLEPTLGRVKQAERERARHTGLVFTLAALLVAALPWAGQARLALPAPAQGAAPALPQPAAIERLEAGDKHAQVFVVGGGSTPVVWLADEAGEDAAADQDPG